MARPYRLEAEGCLYHITNRDNDRRNIFSKKEDYSRFLHYLSRTKERYNFYLYAYVLMSNHYHLLLETPDANLSKIMHYLNSSYTTFFNIKNKRSGHLFQGRYKSLVVEKDAYLLELTRYIHLNPVRAKMVEQPENYPWSSYHEYITNKRKNVGLIDKGKLKAYMDITPKDYRQFVTNKLGKEESLFENVYGGMILGGVKFIKETLAELKGQVESVDVSNRRELQIGPGIDEIVEAVAQDYKLDKEAIYRKSRKLSKKRQIALYLVKRLTRKTNIEIGKSFGISYSAVSKAAGAIEEEIEKDKLLRKKIKSLYSLFKG